MAKETGSRVPGRDPWSRLRDQIGMGCLLLSNTFGAGAAMALLHTRWSFMEKHLFWWTDRALLLELPSVILLQAPWAMRAIFGVPPAGAARSVVRSLFPTTCFTVVLAWLDFFILQAASFWGPVECLIGACVPAIVCASLAVRRFGGGTRGFAGLLPVVCYFNVLFMLWAGQFAVPVVLT